MKLPELVRQNRKLFIGAGIAVVAGAVYLLLRVPVLLAVLRPCYNPELMNMPVIAEFRAGSVVLDGTERVLPNGGRYSYNRYDTYVDAELIEAREERAVFIVYKRETYYPGSEGAPLDPYDSIQHCILTIHPSDTVFRPLPEPVVLRPEDLGDGWAVTEYNETVYELWRDDSGTGQAQVEMFTNFEDRTYRVWLHIERFQDPVAAYRMYESYLHTYVPIDGLRPAGPEYPEMLFARVTNCKPDISMSCSLTGVYEDYNITVAVNSYTDTPYGSRLPIKAAHLFYLLNAVANKLVEGADIDS